MIIEPLKAYEISTENLLNNLIANGIVAFIGGRVEVRRKLHELANLIEAEGEDSLMAYSTINHLYSEIGYGYDKDRFSDENVRATISKFFDQFL
ncbi:hypothetical protein CCD93_23375 [Vibrio sp. T21]|nr:hypothetical protein CCD93_23375 [Vibrio sp. T21]